MHLTRLWLEDFRNYPALDLELHPGVTVLVGPNGVGKTNLVEAIVWLSELGSFRTSTNDALVRTGAEQAIVRAEIVDGERRLLIEAELPRRGRSRVLVNKQRLQRTRDLAASLRVTVFSPEDLVLVKGGPSERRRYLDDALAASIPRADGLLRDVDKVLRQRNALLSGVNGRLDESAALTLDVWGDKLGRLGDELAAARRALVGRLVGPVARGYQHLAGCEVTVGLRYDQSWEGLLQERLAAVRRDDVRRGVTTVGPHRDDLQLVLAHMPARTHASQGEQRCFALALRMAVHALVAEASGSPPVLVLDDVFSELDPRRSAALVTAVPAGQTVITTAVPLPGAVRPDRMLEIDELRAATGRLVRPD